MSTQTAFIQAALETELQQARVNNSEETEQKERSHSGYLAFF